MVRALVCACVHKRSRALFVRLCVGREMVCLCGRAVIRALVRAYPLAFFVQIFVVSCILCLGASLLYAFARMRA